MSEPDYEAIAQKLLDQEAELRAEGWRDFEAVTCAKLLTDAHGPFDLKIPYDIQADWEAVNDY